MGGAASKPSLASAVRSRVIRTNVSLEQVMALSRRVTSPAQVVAGETLSASMDRHDSKTNFMEMQQQMLQNVEKINDFDRVKLLEQSTRAFEDTASSHRPRSSQPVRLPTDKTTAASTSTGIGGINEEKARGRLTARDLRTLLRLHYEEPENWTPQVLADKYGLDMLTMRSILNSVGPPNVLPPKGTSEHPLGVWFDAPKSSPRTPSSTQQQQ
ncbi:unnamed protein product [Peronospora destructor]|uniref:Uncharacterized protein n=1 Tax=Peronospora destructor TaxID=86335 RepID=A0AAV0V202_9STRA|nr:unnamed protein product [Peronospora destructor]